MEIVVGKTFAKFEEVKTFIQTRERENKEKFWIRDSKPIKAVKLKNKVICPELKYFSIKYACIHGGGSFKSRAKGVRKSSTHKMDCPVYILFGVTEDGNQLRIKSCILNHIGHELSKKAFSHLPQVRRLNMADKEKVLDYLSVGGNSKLIQNKIHADTGKNPILKDISNIKYTTKTEFDNDLLNAVQMLRDTYEANVSILEDAEKNFKALYFSTLEMRLSFETWPEIVALDGTYKLLNTNLTVMLLLIIDSEGNSEICGVSLIRNEDYTTFKWFLEMFQSENNKASHNIKCFMGDKDLLERNVIKEVFGEVPVYICMFHTLKTFKRSITTEKLHISAEEKILSLELLAKLVYSASAEQYDANYETFCNSVPYVVVDYFNKNWHDIKHEWALGFMNNGNLNNFTNNRLESINQKIKSVVPKNSTLKNFVLYFFKWLYSNNYEKNHNVSHLVLKRPVVNFSSNSPEYLYRNFLTHYAFAYVLKQLHLSKFVTILEDAATWIPSTSTNNIFCVKSAENLIHVSADHCECGGFSSMLLPCRHIFAIREVQHISLYEENLCHSRWHRSTILKNHRMFVSSEANSTSLAPPALHTVRKIERILTNGEKRKKARIVLDSLLDLASLSSNSNFYNKLHSLEEIERLWRSGHEVKIEPCINEVAESYSLSEQVEHYAVLHSDENNSENVSFSETFRSDNVSAVETNTNKSTLQEDLAAEYVEIIDADTSTPTLTKNIPEENSVDSDIKNILMPLAIKRKGRARDSEKTVIGLPKQRKINISKSFITKSVSEQQVQVLKMLVQNSDIIKLALTGEYQIDQKDLKDYDNIADTVLDERISLEFVKDFFEHNTYQVVVTMINKKKMTASWICLKCNVELGHVPCIQCDSCLHWYHFQCVNLNSVPYKKHFFCKNC